MTITAKKFVTYEDLREFPEGTHAEILHGEIHVSPRPNRGHRFVGARLGSKLIDASDNGRLMTGWIIEAVPDVQFSSDVLIPDIAGWKAERLPDLDPSDTLVNVVPDWTCEIVSPSSGKIDRVEKFNIYLKTGVRYYWIIDPFHKTIEAFENSVDQWKRIGAWGADDKARIAPFEEIEIDLSTLWLQSRK